MRILLTNDDGIYAPGLAALEAELRELGDVTVIAPQVEQSGVSHTITFLQPLIVQEVHRDGKMYGRAVSGSPADCVRLAMLELCKPAPDLVISGLNGGSNTGINVLYSGTVAAAIEGAFFNVTSIACSFDVEGTPDFLRAARYAARTVKELLARGIPTGSLWNVNVPRTGLGEPRGVRFVPMGLERDRDTVERRTDPRGRNYFWSGLLSVNENHLPDSDVVALGEGFITVTPLQFDLTHRAHLEAFRK